MAGAEDLKVLGTRQSMFTVRVLWALKLKGVEYEFIEEDLVHKSSLLLALNPVHKKVPVLVHGGKPIVESKIILEYIDETWKQRPLLPEDPPQRAYARFWAAFIDDKLMEAARKAFATTAEAQAIAVESTTEALNLLEGELQGKKYFSGGEEIGYLDIVAGWIAYWLQFIEEVGGFKAMDSTKFPRLDAWIKNFLQITSVAQNLPPPHELRSIFCAIQDAMQIK
ncbi:putative glutathione S-transferase [Hibiscus syriacus]|uniref:glutathione transferase n=1 Tax=Hibiscus syriacus TaxID=106335 RepID=A0A6A2YYU0_HIBSY|nr:probable glutathione S-transferase [Hibiscus syriacus]KAE8684718.1 putative glutathione S-transferase [Hibiscus syriacus]